MGVRAVNERVIMAKLRIDAHDRGARYVARKLMESGAEVIFLRVSVPQEIVQTCVQEDARVIGVSLFCGGYKTVIARLMDDLRAHNLQGARVFVGGIIAQEDVPELIAMGVKRVFLPGTPVEEVVATMLAPEEEK